MVFQKKKRRFSKTYELASKIKEISLKTPGTFRTSVFQFRPYHGTQLYNEIVKSTGIIHGCEFNKSISQFEEDHSSILNLGIIVRR